ncbi:putative baseplate assembly protein [Paenibacillus kyungheensis]
MTLSWEQISNLASPAIDSRELSDLVREMSELVPFYTPEWRFTPDDPDAGTALFYIFADMLLENIKRLNQAPLNNYLSFLNLIGVEPIHSRAASACLTFQLSKGSTQPVWIPARTPVLAESEGQEVSFETTSSMLVTPTQMIGIYQVDGQEDRIIPIASPLMIKDSKTKEDLTASYRLFDTSNSEQNIQEHILYTAHPILDHLEGATRIEWIPWVEPAYMASDWCQLLADSTYAEWTYWSEGQWKVFDHVQAVKGKIRLSKAAGHRLERYSIEGNEQIWIRCRMVRPLEPNHSSAAQQKDRQWLSTVRLNRVTVKPVMQPLLGIGQRIGEIGITPARLFLDDQELEQEQFYPFGKLFYTYGCFYMESTEVFSKTGSWITLRYQSGFVNQRAVPEPDIEPRWRPVMRASEFDTRHEVYACIERVIWEYWNGQAWVRLTGTTREMDYQFRAPEKRMSTRSERGQYSTVSTESSSIEWDGQPEDVHEQKWEFECPTDLVSTMVNGLEGHWIRARIIELDNAYAPYAIYRTPWIQQLNLQYSYRDSFPIEQFIAVNHGESKIWNSASTASFYPFEALDSAEPACYIVFDQAPSGGPFHMYMELEPLTELMNSDPVAVDWEYWQDHQGRQGWAALEVYDFTEGLTVSGGIQWSAPDDFGVYSRFGQQGYWIRLVDRQRRFGQKNAPYPVVKSIHWNTVPAVQQQSITEEKPDVTQGTDGVYFRLLRTPVHAEEVWVDETHLQEHSEWLRLIQEAPEDIQSLSLPDGSQQVWRKWTAVVSLQGSGALDRHYRIDRTQGEIYFGNGRYGRVPTTVGTGRIKVNYRLSAGHLGNVDQYQINRLRYAKAFIDKVWNPLPAYGGHDREQTIEAVKRGPAQLKHRDRAVTIEDYESLAYEADAHVAKVKCFSGQNAHLAQEAGSITLVIMVKDADWGRRYFPELRKRVRQHLIPRMSAMIFPESLFIIEPVYLEIDVTAEVYVHSMEDLVPVEEECVSRLDRFLNAITGQHDSNGWDIGEQPQPSVFYPLLQSVSGVKYVNKLTIEIFQQTSDQRKELTAQQASMIAHSVVHGGKHNLSVRTDWSQ